MDKPNFKCPKCEKEYFISKYKVFYKDKKVYTDAKGSQLKCECGEFLEDIPKNEGFCINFGSYASATIEERQKMLKKRSNNHFLKEGRDNNVEMERQFIKNRQQREL